MGADAGYEFIDQAMHDEFTWRMLALLAAFKILSTSLSFVSGTPGGMFAPALFIGAMIGGAVGSIEHHFFPWLTGQVGTYALVGMGTLFAAFLRVPMTSVFMVLEVSGNYWAPTVTSQGTQCGWFDTDLSVKQSLLNRSLSITLRVGNVLGRGTNA